MPTIPKIEELEQNHPRFILFCDAEGISLEHPDDYGPWYRCWIAAQEALIDNDYGPPTINIEDINRVTGLNHEASEVNKVNATSFEAMEAFRKRWDLNSKDK